MPIRDHDEKEDVLDALLTAKRKGQRLALRLRLCGLSQEAEGAERKARELARAVDVILGKAMDAWAGSAEDVRMQVAGINRRLELSITHIKQGIKVAENVVTAVGLIDDAIKIAAALAA